jgi:hypothetical protein
MNSLPDLIHYLVDRVSHPTEEMAIRAHNAAEAHAQGFETTEEYLRTQAAEAVAKDPNQLQRQLEAELDAAKAARAQFEKMNAEAMAAIQHTQDLQKQLAAQAAGGAPAEPEAPADKPPF